MGRDPFSETRYRGVADDVKKEGGSATHKGEQRHREGKGLHELVDPKGYGVIRISNGPREKKGKKFILVRGVGMLLESLIDTTGSMGNNVDKAFDVLPKTYNLLANGKQAVLGRYDIQIINAIFGDELDDYILCRSQAEMDERIAEQLRLMVPCRNGGDTTEDPHYGLFGAAYLTKTEVARYGLKHYHFLTTDAPTRTRLTMTNLKKVFGDSVLERAKENGFEFTESKLPNVQQIVKDLLKSAHAFMLQVDSDSGVTAEYEGYYGEDRVIKLPGGTVNFLPEVQAAIIGLTEGVLNLQNLEEYLVTEAQLKLADAKSIAKAVSKIPIGLQTEAENFDKIPLKGAEFATKDALWPIGSDAAEEVNETSSAATDDEEIKWE